MPSKSNKIFNRRYPQYFTIKYFLVKNKNQLKMKNFQYESDKMKTNTNKYVNN